MSQPSSPQPNAPDPSPQPAAPPPGPVPPSKDECNMAMLAHLLGIFTGVIGPLIIWLVKKEDSPYVDEQGKEALNFHITVVLALVVVIFFACITLGFGALLMPVLWAVIIVFSILATVAASRGEHYRYPCTLRLIK